MLCYGVVCCHSSLNLGGPFIVGHLPDNFNYNYEGTSFNSLDFCVRELVINGRVQDFSDPLGSFKLSASCEMTQCTPDPCKNGGRCIGTQRSFTCVCPVEFAGETCNERKSKVIIKLAMKHIKLSCIKMYIQCMCTHIVCVCIQTRSQ